MGVFGWIRGLTRRNKQFCCDDVAEMSSDYVDDSLSPSISTQFKTHMDSCPDCNTFYATFRATVLTIRDLPKRSAPPDLKQRIQDQIASQSGGQSGPAS